jgi:hypothetical protein
LETLEDRRLPATVTWTNPAGGDWDRANNWLDDQGVNRKPGPNDQAIIDIPGQNGFTVTHSSSAAESAYSLTSQDALVLSGGSLSVSTDSAINNALALSGATLTGSGNLTVTGLFSWTAGTLAGPVGSSLTAQGGMTLGGSMSLDGRTLNNAATATWAASPIVLDTFNGPTINNLAGATFTIRGDENLGYFQTGATPVFNNAGLLDLQAVGDGILIHMAIQNSGTIQVDSGTVFLGTYVQTAGSTILDGGSLTGPINLQGGVLKGNGTITGSVINAGQVSPGFSPGLLNLQGDYTQTNPGDLFAEIGGVVAGSQYDQLTVSGSVILGGSLHITLVNGFTPHLADPFTLLDNRGSNPINGTFTGLLEGSTFQVGPAVWQISYRGGDGNDVTLTYTDTLPSGLTLTPSAAALNEGDSLNLAGSFADPDSGDAHTVLVNWGDGSANTTVNLAAGVLSFSGVSHPYLDNPTGQPAGSFPVSVTVTDSFGYSVSAGTSVQVKNVAPALAIAGAPASSPEGTAINLGSTVADPGPVDQASPFTFTWSVSKNGNPYAAQTASGLPGSPAGSVSFTPDDNGTYVVNLTATDKDGGVGTATAQTIAVTNVAPANVSLTLSAASINEGQSVTLGGTFTDPGVLDTHVVVITWGDGSATTTLNLAAGVLSFSGVNHTYQDNPAGQPTGSFPISVTVTDKDGGQGTGSTPIQVKNVAPTASLSGPSLGVPGQPRTFTFAATDPSPIDQAAGFAYAITWGDGSTTSITATAGNGAGVAMDHVYTSTGSYTVQMTATDKDGGASATAAQAISVQTVEMEGNSLAVGGTLGNDIITLSPADALGTINVTAALNGSNKPVSLGNFKPTDHILVYGQTGNDTIQLSKNKISGTTYYIAVPAFLYGGGTGKDIDTLDARGSSANNVLIGGAGKSNTLYGGLGVDSQGNPGRDILIAGLGASTLNSGVGDDILIGGWTDYDLTSTAMTYDKKLTALEAIMAEWGRTDLTGSAQQQYSTRVNDLSNGGGLNSSYLLNAATVHENGQVDTLFGTTGAALDCFFAGLSDVVKNKKTGEVQTLIS